MGVIVQKLLASKHWNAHSEKSKNREKRLGQNWRAWRHYRNSSNLQYSKYYYVKYKIEGVCADEIMQNSDHA